MLEFKMNMKLTDAMSDRGREGGGTIVFPLVAVFGLIAASPKNSLFQKKNLNYLLIK